MSVQKRPDGKYRARYRDPAGRERARHFDRKIDADRWVAAKKTAVARGEWVDPALSDIAVGEWAPVWLDSKAALKPTSRREYESLWRVRLAPRWEDTRLRAVTYADATTWMAGLTAQGLSPSSVRKTVMALKQLLNLAVADGRLPRNVIESMKSPRSIRGEQRFLTHDELAALAESCGRVSGQHRVMTLLTGYTGLRWGEVRALRVKHVDMLRARLDVVENMPDGSTEAETVDPKNHKRRTVPFPRFLLPDLATILEGKGRNELVFTTSRRTPLDNSNWRRNVFDPAVDAADVAPFTPHNLRDTAASLAVSAGANVKAVQRMLGHASAAMTLDVYAGLFSDDLDQVAERLDTLAVAAHEARTSRFPRTAEVVALPTTKPDTARGSAD